MQRTMHLSIVGKVKSDARIEPKIDAFEVRAAVQIVVYAFGLSN